MEEIMKHEDGNVDPKAHGLYQLDEKGNKTETYNILQNVQYVRNLESTCAGIKHGKVLWIQNTEKSKTPIKKKNNHPIIKPACSDSSLSLCFFEQKKKNKKIKK